MIEFEWDSAKAAANLRKHGVSFEEARSVFYDEFAVQFFDEDHSTDEERFLLLGMSTGARLLLVCHCERKGRSHCSHRFCPKSHQTRKCVLRR